MKEFLLIQNTTIVTMDLPGRKQILSIYITAQNKAFNMAMDKELYLYLKYNHVINFSRN